MGFQAVIFSLGSEEYGLPIEVVQEITRLAGVHPIPQAPNYIKGLISIRGQAIPLIDMHQKFGIQSQNEAEYAIIIEINGSLVGFAVEEVREVRHSINIAPPPPSDHRAFHRRDCQSSGPESFIQIHPERILEDKELPIFTS
jgi:purine-binding chemotaxis protein CheW